VYRLSISREVIRASGCAMLESCISQSVPFFMAAENARKWVPDAMTA